MKREILPRGAFDDLTPQGGSVAVVAADIDGAEVAAGTSIKWKQIEIGDSVALTLNRLAVAVPAEVVRAISVLSS